MRRRRRWPVIVAVVVAGLAVGAWLLLRDLPPGHGHLAARLDDVDLPDDLRRTGGERAGNRLCFDECPLVARTYVTRTSLEDALAAFERVLARQGFDVTAGPPRTFEPRSSMPVTAFQSLAAERDDELLCVELSEGSPTLTSAERLPSGRVGVRLTFELDRDECRGLES